MLRKNLWGRDIDPYKGLPANTISYVLKKKRNFLKLPQMFWTSEIYSLGKAYRSMLNIPKWLYLPFYSDHGYSALGYMGPHELGNKSNVHITFNKYRYEKIKDLSDKRVIHYTHPYIDYRKKNGIVLDKLARGTLVFYTHTIDKVRLSGFSLEEYIDLLNELPNQYKPFVFMFHVNDIRKGNHKPFLKKGFPIVTAGDQSDNYFIDRLYDILRHFKYATSNSGGSELFYCSELGVSYFLYGKAPKLINEGHKENKMGDIAAGDEIYQYLNKRKRELFGLNSSSSEEERIKFVNESIGIDPEIKEEQFRKLIFREYRRTVFKYIRIIYSRIFSNGK